MKNAWRNKLLWFSLIMVFSIVLLNRTIYLYSIFWLNVINDGEITATSMGSTLCAEGDVKNELSEQMLEDVKSHWRDLRSRRCVCPKVKGYKWNIEKENYFLMIF